MDLQKCREQLDEIDGQIVELFERRMEISGGVAEYKIETGKAVYDGAREQQKLSTLEAMAHGEFNRLAVRELFSQIMTISRRFQYRMLAEHGKGIDLGFVRQKDIPRKDMRVVYQGVEGSYSHGATKQYFGSDVEVYHVVSFEDVMQEVQQGRADYGVLPIENSSAGAVTDNYDLLIQYDNYIVAETFLPVSHALLGRPEANLSTIHTVFSHPQGLMQCSEFLNSHREWKQISLENTAVAAKKITEDLDITQAAVASEIAGQLYGLKVLQSSVQNNQNNTTRFIILSRKAIYCEQAGKISISFELPHKSGALYNILGNFIFNSVNISKIESRPIPKRNWEYRFFVDIEGNLEDAGVRNALKGIGEEAQNMRILGNY